MQIASYPGMPAANTEAERIIAEIDGQSEESDQ